MTDKTSAFDGLGIDAKLLRVITELKYSAPTPIQAAAIPAALQGADVIGIAQTGTGKTLAFGVPMVQRLLVTGGCGLIVVPTRELALQVGMNMERIASAHGLGCAVLIGGVEMQPQMDLLKKRPSIIIATPGRLIDHIDRGTFRPDSVRFLVLDEADRMLDLGFAREITEILRAVPKERQTLLFSATMPSDIEKLAASHMRLPVTVEAAPPGTAAEPVTQELFIVKEGNKRALLMELLEQYPGQVLVFTRTKKGASAAAGALKRSGVSAAEIHSDRAQQERRAALEGFKSGRYRVLVATDVAARGIDVTGIELVINYDLPDETVNYVHRIGRTGRAGRPGHAISFAAPDQAATVKNIEKMIKKEIPVSKQHGAQNEEFSEIPYDSPLVNPHMHSPVVIQDRDHKEKKRKRERPDKEDRWR